MKLFVVLFLVATSLTALVQSQSPDSKFVKVGSDFILQTCKKALSNNEPLPQDVRTICENLLGNNGSTTAAPTAAPTTARTLAISLEDCKAQVAKFGSVITNGLSCEVFLGLAPNPASTSTSRPIFSNLEELLKPSKVKVSLGGKISAGK